MISYFSYLLVLPPPPDELPALLLEEEPALLLLGLGLLEPEPTDPEPADERLFPFETPVLF